MMGMLRDTGFAVGMRLTRLSLRFAGFRRTVSLLGGLPTPLAEQPAQSIDVARWVDVIRRMGGRPYGASCLDRSVFLWFVMRQRGLVGQIRIGVTSDGDRLDGHAWVEHDGVVVNDDPNVATRFAVFDGDPIGIVFS